MFVLFEKINFLIVRLRSKFACLDESYWYFYVEYDCYYVYLDRINIFKRFWIMYFIVLFF